jgi:hypothetical protein
MDMIERDLQSILHLGVVKLVVPTMAVINPKDQEICARYLFVILVVNYNKFKHINKLRKKATIQPISYVSVNKNLP